VIGRGKWLVLFLFGLGIIGWLSMESFWKLLLSEKSSSVALGSENNADEFEITTMSEYRFYMNNIPSISISSFLKYDDLGKRWLINESRSGDRIYCLISYMQPYEVLRGLGEQEKINLDHYVGSKTAGQIRDYKTPFRYGQIELRAILVITDTSFEILDFTSTESGAGFKGFSMNDQVDDRCIYTKGSTVKVIQDIVAFSGRNVE
jgi:hypothetical protein